MLATSIRNRELSVDRSSTIQLVGRRWVYYRRAALLKESYLLSSLLTSFLPKVLSLPVRFRRRAGTRCVGDGT
jgi:hypothetical protein